MVGHFGPFFSIFFLLHFYENPSKVLGYQGWDKILMITLISSKKSPTPNISAASACTIQFINLQSFAQVFFYEFLKEQLHNCIDCKKNAKLCFSCDMKALLLLRVIKVMEFCDSGFELAWVAMVPGTRRIFGQYCLAHAGFGNFTT